MSMVHDHYQPLFPQPAPMPDAVPAPSIINPLGGWVLAGQPLFISQEEADRLRGLIDSFRKACEAAAIVDRLTAQPDCADPEKLKLEERVQLLERELAELKKRRGFDPQRSRIR